MQLTLRFPALSHALTLALSALVIAFQPAMADDRKVTAITIYPTEIRIVSEEKNALHLTVRSQSPGKHPTYPLYIPKREGEPSWPVFFKATAERPLHDIKREFRFQQRYWVLVEALDDLMPEDAVMSKIHSAMKEGARGDTRFPVSTLDTFEFARLPRDAVELAILEHFYWKDEYLEDLTRDNNFFSSVNYCMIFSYALEAGASKRYTNFYDIRITFERVILPGGNVDAYMLATAEPTYTCDFGEHQKNPSY
jgi:hypothetical protein